MCAHVKDPISICCKRVGLTAGGMETRKHCRNGEKKELGIAPFYGCLLSPGKAAQISRGHWERKVTLYGIELKFFPDLFLSENYVLLASIQVLMARLKEFGQ